MLGKQVTVGYDNIRALIIIDLAGAYANLLYNAQLTGYLYQVTHLDRPFKCKYYTRYQVVYDVLQTKANTYSQGTDHDGQLIKRNACRGHGDTKADSPDR